MMKVYMFSHHTTLPAHELQLLNQLDDIVLRKAVEDLYQRDRQSAINGERILPPVGGFDDWSTLFQPGTDELLMVGDFWEEINSIGFDECNIDFFPLTTATASPRSVHESGQEDFVVASSENSGTGRALDDKEVDAMSTDKDSLSDKLIRSIKLLPACNACRRRRVRCDRQLPACSHCKKVQNRCMYHDHVLAEDIPRE
jgi:hypothetical protein